MFTSVLSFLILAGNLVGINLPPSNTSYNWTEVGTEVGTEVLQGDKEIVTYESKSLMAECHNQPDSYMFSRNSFGHSKGLVGFGLNRAIWRARRGCHPIRS